MRVAVLDDRVKAAQKIAVGAGDLRRLQRVQNRLVVLVDQHRDGLSGLLVQSFQHSRETTGGRGVLGNDRRAAFDGGELLHEARLHVARLLEVAATEAQAQDGMAHRPIPAVVDRKPFEQRLVALEQLLARIQEQALAKAPRA